MMIDNLGSSTRETTENIQEQDKLLKSLRQVNEDDTLSRVLCSDLPATRASEDDSGFSGSLDGTDLNEEVTLCAVSHAETKMAECISDGIEATDIGSLLEQFLEYEKAISPALSPVASSFPTPVTSPGLEKKFDLKPNTKKRRASTKLKKVHASSESPPLTPMEELFNEIADFDMLVDNQVTISTTSEDDNLATEGNDICEDVESEDSDVKKEGKQDCFIVNRNGIVVVEYRDVSETMNTKEENKTDVNGAHVEKIDGNQDKEVNCEKEAEKGDTKVGTEISDIEMKAEGKSGENANNGVEENNDDDGDDEALNVKLRSVIGNYYRIPKIPRSSKTRSKSRSRSPLTRHSSSRRSYERSKSRDYSSSSDDDGDDRRERYERYKSERRTPMRRDDRRKRRKYSSCSDDEYDYYRFSKRGSSSSSRDNVSWKSHYEHDYNKPRTRHREYHRSSSVRERGERDYSRSRRPCKKERHDDDDNVHERISELVDPVPYDIEQERKIGFLVKEMGGSSHERRNVYAGGINRNSTRRDLIRRFECFGPVEKVTLHFRDTGDNYAFIVFEDAKDAIKAVRDGNKDPNYDPLDLCFGGRRKFVGGSYVDFDANISYLEENELTFPKPATPTEDLEFDALLEMAKRQQSID